MPWLVRVGGARPPPFITLTITSKVAVYAPAEWADTLTLFHLLENMYSERGSNPPPPLAEQGEHLLYRGMGRLRGREGGGGWFVVSADDRREKNLKKTTTKIQ